MRACLISTLRDGLIQTVRVPRHFGKAKQPQNSWPARAPRRDLRFTICELQTGQCRVTPAEATTFAFVATFLAYPPPRAERTRRIRPCSRHLKKRPSNPAAIVARTSGGTAFISRA